MSSLFDRTMELLRFMAEAGAPVGVTQLSRELGIPKSSVSRMLSMLADYDYAAKLPNGRFVVGPGAMLPANAYKSRDKLLKICRPYIESLAHLTDQSAFTLVYTGRGRLYLADEVMVSGTIRHKIKMLGQTVNLPCTSGGKAVLMHLPERELQDFIAAYTFTAYTPTSVLSREELLRQLEFFRKRGFSEDSGEFNADICAVAAPVLDKNSYPLGCISVASSTFLKNRAEMVRVGQVVADVSRQINEKIRSTR